MTPTRSSGWPPTRSASRLATDEERRSSVPRRCRPRERRLAGHRRRGQVGRHRRRGGRSGSRRARLADRHEGGHRMWLIVAGLLGIRPPARVETSPRILEAPCEGGRRHLAEGGGAFQGCVEAAQKGEAVSLVAGQLAHHRGVTANTAARAVTRSTRTLVASHAFRRLMPSRFFRGLTASLGWRRGSMGARRRSNLGVRRRSSRRRSSRPLHAGLRRCPSWTRWTGASPCRRAPRGRSPGGRRPTWGGKPRTSSRTRGSGSRNAACHQGNRTPTTDNTAPTSTPADQRSPLAPHLPFALMPVRC